MICIDTTEPRLCHPGCIYRVRRRLKQNIETKMWKEQSEQLPATANVHPWKPLCAVPLGHVQSLCTIFSEIEPRNSFLMKLFKIDEYYHGKHLESCIHTVS